MQSEHLTRYINRRHIRVLEWNENSIRYLLREKLHRLDPAYVMEDPDNRRVATWLGLRHIRNKRKQVDEDIERYLIRHTRLIPRDVVILGNMLHSHVVRARRAGEAFVPQPAIRSAVHDAATLFGKEQLAICANQIAIGNMPHDAPFAGYSELYSGSIADQVTKGDIAEGIVYDRDQGTYVYRGLDVYEGDNVAVAASAAYQRAAVDELRQLVGEMRRDRFSGALYHKYRAMAEERFPDVDVMSILWQNGLLGVVDGSVLKGGVHFYGASELDTLHIPDCSDGYALHPCLIDAAGVRGICAPVYPGSMVAASDPISQA